MMITFKLRIAQSIRVLLQPHLGAPNVVGHEGRLVREGMALPPSLPSVRIQSQQPLKCPVSPGSPPVFSVVPPSPEGFSQHLWDPLGGPQEHTRASIFSPSLLGPEISSSFGDSLEGSTKL